MINPERYGINITTSEYSISADPNTAPILTGEVSGADEITDLGITYRTLDRLLRAGLANADARISEQPPVDRSEFHLIRPKSKRD